jgi:hypothetical protein
LSDVGGEVSEKDFVAIAHGLLIDCGKFTICQSGTCFCSATSCRLRVPEDPTDPTQFYVRTMSFDLALAGNVAMGSMDSTNIYLTKDE